MKYCRDTFFKELSQGKTPDEALDMALRNAEENPFLEFCKVVISFATFVLLIACFIGLLVLIGSSMLCDMPVEIIIEQMVDFSIFNACR